jgi:hypothetical protein
LDLHPTSSALEETVRRDWLTASLSKLDVFRGRLLGDLSSEEFAKLLNSQILPKIQSRWGDLDEGWRNLHDAILGRVRFERLQQTKPGNVSQEAAMAEPASPRADVPQGSSVEQVAVPIAAGRYRMMPAPNNQQPGNVSAATPETHRTIPAVPQPVAEQSDAPSWTQDAPLSPSAPFLAPAPLQPTVEEAASLPIAPAPIQRAPAQTAPAESPRGETPEVLANTNGTNRVVEQIPEDEPASEPSANPAATQSSALIRMPDSDEVLQRLELANNALDQAISLEAVKELADVGVAVHAYTIRAKRGKLAQNKAAAYVIRAMAKLGRMMPASRETNQLRKRGGLQKVRSGPFPESVTEKPSTLDELGIGKREADQARRLARFSVAEFETRLQAKLEKGELSRTATLEDPKPKKEAEVTRAFRMLLEDFRKTPANYDPQRFVRDEKLLECYRAVGEEFRRFFDAFEVEISGRSR